MKYYTLVLVWLCIACRDKKPEWGYYTPIPPRHKAKIDSTNWKPTIKHVSALSKLWGDSIAVRIDTALSDSSFIYCSFYCKDLKNTRYEHDMIRNFCRFLLTFSDTLHVEDIWYTSHQLDKPDSVVYYGIVSEKSKEDKIKLLSLVTGVQFKEVGGQLIGEKHTSYPDNSRLISDAKPFTDAVGKAVEQLDKKYKPVIFRLWNTDQRNKVRKCQINYKSGEWFTLSKNQTIVGRYPK